MKVIPTRLAFPRSVVVTEGHRRQSLSIVGGPERRAGETVGFANPRAKHPWLKQANSETGSWHWTWALWTCLIFSDYKEANGDGVVLLGQ